MGLAKDDFRVAQVGGKGMDYQPKEPIKTAPPNLGSSVSDPVNSPPHYTQGGIECIDAIKAALTPEEYRGYCKGNIIKYIWRERHKGQDESVAKAIWYAKRLIGGG
jgi:hypothetical protein